jgi:hypothetical protein
MVLRASKVMDWKKKTAYLQNGEEIMGVDTVIIAFGCSPLVEPLSLSAAGISQKESRYKGAIAVKEYL